jgi:hypothetical protein
LFDGLLWAGIEPAERIYPPVAFSGNCNRDAPDLAEPFAFQSMGIHHGFLLGVNPALEVV